MVAGYERFLKSKRVTTREYGFDVPISDLNPRLKEWQKLSVQWALRRGRAAFFQDCGLGKTFQQLVWAEMVHKRTGGPILLLCPVAVAEQTKREHAKFWVDCKAAVVADQSEVIDGINITNYEKLHHFKPEIFTGVVLDESSILKSYAGKTKRQLCEMFRNTDFRLACTATPAPNDHMELGNHADFLGIMPSNEMLARWFINDTMKCGGYRLTGHGQDDFWRWVCSWAVAISKPSDIGFSDEGYDLPGLNVIEHIVESDAPEGFLFSSGRTVSATEVHTEKRAALEAKANVVADLVQAEPDEAWMIWVDTNYEADAVRKLIPDAVEVRGSDSEKVKAERLLGFTEGRFKWLITKPECGGFGMNFQHCRRTTYFPGFSFERWYQSIRRLWRFGQKSEVDVHFIMGDNEESVADSLRSKSEDHMKIVGEMSRRMKDGMREELGGRKILRTDPVRSVPVPEWLNTRG